MNNQTYYFQGNLKKTLSYIVFSTISIIFSAVAVEDRQQQDIPQHQNTELHIRKGDNLSSTLERNIGNLQFLRKLSLHGCKIGDDGISTILLVANNIAALEYLDLTENNITTAGCARLNTLLSRLPNLQSLNLSHNSINKIGIKLFKDSLKNLPNLTYLNLGCNNEVYTSNYNGIEEILDVLTNCRFSRTLREISLCNMHISNDDGILLASIITRERFPNLQEVHFYDMGLGQGALKNAVLNMPPCKWDGRDEK